MIRNLYDLIWYVIGFTTHSIRRGKLRNWIIWLDDGKDDYVERFSNRRFLREKSSKKKIFRHLDDKKNAELVFKTLSPYLDKTSNIHEYGAGFGRLLAHIEEWLPKTCALTRSDISLKLIRTKICNSEIAPCNILENLTVEKYVISCSWAVFMYFNDVEIERTLPNMIKTSQICLIFELPNTLFRILKVLKRLNDKNIDSKIKLVPIWSLA